MKVRVKSNNEIIDVIQVLTETCSLYDLNQVEFLDNPQDYWTRLEHQYAGMAMQGMLAGTYYQGLSHDRVVEDAQYIAHALVEKYKKEETK